MYKVERKNHFFVLERGGKLHRFENYLELLIWIQRPKFSRWFYVNNIPPGKIDKARHNWNDTYRLKLKWCYRNKIYSEHSEGTFPIEYIVYDANMRVLSLLDLDKDSEKLVPVWENWSWQRIKKNWLGFRRGPVPHTAYKNKGWRIYYRRPRTTRSLRLNENDSYCRPKRRKLSTFWDEKPRNFYKCWKQCTKKRKQWMK